MLHAQCGEQNVNALIGPPQAHAGGWRTPLVTYPYDGVEARAWKQLAERFGRDLGYVVRSTTRNKTRR
jgi:hypothetical protein